jgi:hypothetical protein
MVHDSDTLVKEHLQEILCEAEKNHALSLLHIDHLNQHHPTALKTHRQLESPEIRLQDCAISPSYSDSHI